MMKLYDFVGVFVESLGMALAAPELLNKVRACLLHVVASHVEASCWSRWCSTGVFWPTLTRRCASVLLLTPCGSGDSGVVNSRRYPLMECLSSFAHVLGDAFVGYAPPLFARSLAVLEENMMYYAVCYGGAAARACAAGQRCVFFVVHVCAAQAAAAADEPAPPADPICVSLDLISGQCVAT